MPSHGLKKKAIFLRGDGETLNKYKEPWKYFIDAKDWERAVQIFPKQPWKFYLKPQGKYPVGSWGFFKKALTWLTEESSKFSYPFLPHKALKLETLTTLSSLLQFGVIGPWKTIIRNNDLVWVTRPYEIIKPVFSSTAPLFKNSAQIDLKVIGFIEPGLPMLDVIILQNKIKGFGANKKGDMIKKALASSRPLIEEKVSKKSDLWGILFPFQRKVILEHLDQILRWCHLECESIMTHHEPGSPSYERSVTKLAVQMQSLVDMTHFSVDASGRTSKLLQNYLCFLFGVTPPSPVLFEYKNRPMENGTYLPLNIALKMAWQGSQRRYERGH